MTLDPVVANVVMATLAIVFIVGASQKLRDLMSFEVAVEAYELLPLALVKPVAISLPVIELGAGIALLFESTQTIAISVAAVLLLVVTAAVAINLARGHTDVGCGCGGIEDEQLLSWALVIRNLLLMALLGLLLLGTTDRQTVWFDYVSTAFATITAYALYVSANQLIANRPRLMTLRRAS